MNKIIEEMLNSLHPESNEEKKNALKEVIQEIALCGLSRGGFFHKTAFYGGTALRIFYGLDRFSEDLDFSLMKPDDKFDLKGFFPYLENEFQAYGFDLKIELKEKTVDSAIRSAFIKGRDLYDYIFYLSHNTKVNMSHLRHRLIESGYISTEDKFDIDEVRSMLNNRFGAIDFLQAKKDVMPFMKDPQSLEVWNSDFFKQITCNLMAR